MKNTFGQATHPATFFKTYYASNLEKDIYSLRSLF